MKKLFFCLCAASAMLFTACSDEAVNAPAEGESLVTITAQLPADLGTRAFGDGKTATNLTYAVYEEGSQTPLITSTDDVTFSGLTATVNLRLANGKKYDLVFWADAADAPYTFNARNQTVSIDYTGVTSNLENRDAFFAHEDALHVTGTINKTIKLYRPFAQLNIGATDYAAATTAAFTTASSAVKVNHVANALNIHTGVATGDETITFDYAAVPDDNTETFPVTVVDADYLAMNYLLVNVDKQLVDVEFTAKSNKNETITRSYANVPVQRNFRTNIYGNILTEDANFNIVIVPDFETPDYDFEVGTEQELKNAAAQGGSARLVANVDLTGDLTIAAGKELTMDLNGHTLNIGASYKLDADEGTINCSNGKITCTSSAISAPSIRVTNTGVMNFDNVEFETNTTLFIVGQTASLTITNSNLKAGAYCVSTNASSSAQNPTIVLENSTFEGYSPILVNIPCQLTITGCTTNATMHGLVVRGGTATLKDSTFNLNYTDDDASVMANYFTSRNWGSGNMVNLAAMTIGNKYPTAYQYATNVTVENCAFNVLGEYASLFPAVYAYANSGEGIGVTLTYDAATTFNGGKGLIVGSTNVKINGADAAVNE